ncbi:FAD-binding oxidoreductase [Alphaproteobacteria bacterium KMM 3653]|uniref:FAD-binding oxidoreductase n=1 Tax=Harenicola maris TaxID=2841044 RepID=A0AAP2CRJ2_9RHOB|nr:FAD-binding oxidoreductase [Harenicola maris]
MNLLHANDRPGEYPQGYYAATAAQLPPAPPLRGEATADCCIIGGGFTGASAALHLAQKGVSVTLLEAQRMGFGASGRNGGQVSGGFNKGGDYLAAKLGTEPAQRLWDMSQEAVTLTRDLITKHAPDAEWTPGVFHAASTRAEAESLLREAEDLQKTFGYDQLSPVSAQDLPSVIASPAYRGGALDTGAAHIHPLRYALGLARAAQLAGARLHERSEVHALKRQGGKWLVQTGKGRVLADQVILACNGYLGGLNRHVAARVMPINNYIAATAPLGDLAQTLLPANAAVADDKFVVNYFRLSSDGRMLFGGGESYGYRFPADIAAKVRKPMTRIFPQLAEVPIDYAWGGTLAITRSRLPLIGEVAPGLLTASGYSGHGVALAGYAGRVLADAAHGDRTDMELLARLPTGPWPGGAGLRSPLLALGMGWFALRDRLGL